MKHAHKPKKDKHKKDEHAQGKHDEDEIEQGRFRSFSQKYRYPKFLVAYNCMKIYIFFFT